MDTEVRPVRVALVNDTRVDLHWGCVRVMRTIRHLLAERGMEVACVVPAHADWKDWSDEIAAVDLVVANGEGTCHSNRPQAARLLALGRFARERGIPSALINASWSNNPPALVSAAADWDLVSVRESLSAGQLQAGGVEAEVVPDLSLYGEDPSKAQREGIGFSDSVVPAIRLRLESVRREVAGEYVPIQYPAPGLAGSYAFVRSVVSRRSLRSPRDTAVLIGQRFREHRAAFTSEEQFVEALSTRALLVTSRFHSLAMALATGTPFLAVVPPVGSTETDGNKIRGLLADSGLGLGRVTDLDGLTAEAVRAAGAFDQRESRALADFLDSARHRTRALFDRMHDMAINAKRLRS